ncbi:MAG: hypothetical protein IPG72_06100 [Ardenticatenales bacterium]|nr:hypothetical protein [Ardenticatenales bacterium]
MYTRPAASTARSTTSTPPAENAPTSHAANAVPSWASFQTMPSVVKTCSRPDASRAIRVGMPSMGSTPVRVAFSYTSTVCAVRFTANRRTGAPGAA